MIGGLSMTEVIIILGLALLLLGPDQLPSLAKSLGKGLRELRKATDDIKSQFESEIARIDINEPAKPPVAPVAPVAGTLENDPAAARAAARRAASASVAAQLSLVSPEGTVPRPQEGAASAPQGAASTPQSDAPAAQESAAQSPESAAADARQESGAAEAPAAPEAASQEQKA